MSDRRRTLAPMAAWNVAGWIGTAAYAFLVTRLIVRSTDEHAYGIWATVLAVRAFIMCLDGGLSFGLSRDAALGPSHADDAAPRMRAAMRIYAALGAVALVVFALAAGLPALLLRLDGADIDVARGVTLLLGAETAAALVGNPLAAILRGRQRFDALAVTTWAQAVLGVALIEALIPEHGLVGAAWAAFLSRAAVSAATWLWMRGAGLLPPKGAAPASARRAVLAFATPLWLAVVGARIGTGTDVPILGGLYGAGTAGQYALGVALPVAAAGLLFAAMDASFPRMVAAADADRRVMGASLLFMASFLAAVGFGFIAFHEASLLRVWLGESPPFVVDVALLTCVTWTVNAPAHMLVTMAVARREHRVVGPIGFGESFVNLAISFALATWWSPLGPAVGTVAVASVSNLIVYPAVLRGPLGLTWSSIVRPSVYGFGLGLSGAVAVWAILQAIDGGPMTSVLLGSFLTLAVAGVVLDLTVRGESQIRRTIALTRRGGWTVLKRRRVEVAAERARLSEERTRSPMSWERPPLVTVPIVVTDAGRPEVARAVASALAQTHAEVEVLVVGDGGDHATIDVVSSAKDPRVRFVEMPQRDGAPPMRLAVDVARGDWIAPLDAGDEFTPDHVESLLAACRERGLEFAYGAADVERTEGDRTRCGSWPPRRGQVARSAAMWSSRIGLRPDAESWKLAEPDDWNLWRRMRDAGVEMGFVDRVVCRQHRDARDASAPPPFWSGVG